MPSARAIHGIVLAGGRGTRMGGVDKGLQLHRGRPLALLAAERLAPQVGSLSISANRHPDEYRRFGWPVWSDDPPGDRGPLDGLATALRRASSAWLAAVPCDSPDLPPDLVARLSDAVDRQEADVAVALTLDPDGTRRPHPVVCLLRTELHEDLRHALNAGERRVGAWMQRQRMVEVPFDDAAAFANLNTVRDLDAQPVTGTATHVGQRVAPPEFWS